jgi:hypothetical protein
MYSLTHLGRGLLGLVAFIGVAVLFSTNRRRIPWRVVGVGLALQLVLGWAVLKVPLVRAAFEAVGRMAFVASVMRNRRPDVVTPVLVVIRIWFVPPLVVEQAKIFEYPATAQLLAFV